MAAPEIRLTTRGEYVGAQWRTVTRGVRRHSLTDDEFLADLHAWQRLLPPGGRFTHLTAARVLGWWLPPLPEDLPVFVAVPATTRIRRPGLATVRRAAEVPADEVDGLRVDSPAYVLMACARDLCALDLTCLLESARRTSCCSPADVLKVADACRGARRLRAACRRSDDRAESIYEVLLRELHRACGVAVEPQYDVHDVTGTHVARGDLWLVGTRRLHEYDGGDHMERRQQRSDRRRERRLDRAGWGRAGYTKEDVLHQGVTILADADAAIGREHDPARIRAWHALLRESLFTPAGTALVRRRLGLPASGHSEASRTRSPLSR